MARQSRARGGALSTCAGGPGFSPPLVLAALLVVMAGARWRSHRAATPQAPLRPRSRCGRLPAEGRVNPAYRSARSPALWHQCRRGGALAVNWEDAVAGLPVLDSPDV